MKENKKLDYIAGRVNLAATIFVPFKCGNNCEFCTSKNLYNGFYYSDEAFDRIMDSIDLCNNVTAIKEFVITGGEPIVSLEDLMLLVEKCHKPVYINTTLPLITNLDECIDYINSEDKIRGINISRHIGFTHSVKVAGLEQINKIKKPIRINSIVRENLLGKALLDFIDYYATEYRMINLRADYRTVTLDTLKNRDTISTWLLEHFKMETLSGCMVCNSEFYSDEEYKVICYHRGLEHSSVEIGGRCYVNDIIIDMHGNIFRDWDMKKDSDFINILTTNSLKL